MNLAMVSIVLLSCAVIWLAALCLYFHREVNRHRNLFKRMISGSLPVRMFIGEGMSKDNVVPSWPDKESKRSLQ